MAAAGEDAQEKVRVTDDPRWALVERVGASPALQRAPRLRELFRYLCECAVRNPDTHITEQQVGVAVFERPVGYDTNADTIVRVQVSQLRRKLEHHFLSDGKDEPVVIDLPKGSYLPVFRPRPEVAADPSARIAPTPVSPWWRRPVAWIVGAVIVVNAAILLWSTSLHQGASAPPHVAQFWRQFTGGRATQVVLSDVGVTMLADVLARPIVLKDYMERTYPTLLMADLALDANVRSAVAQAAVKGFTNAQDAVVAHGLAIACDRQAPSTATVIVSARYLKLDPARHENLVFLGHRRSSPWIELFDKPLNFAYRFDEAKRMASFENRAPQTGEEKSYGVQWGRRGYCLVAYLPKPSGDGSVLLISATDWVSGNAGGQFVTDEASLASLYRRLGVSLTQPLPHFEVLLEVELTGTVAASYRAIAHRVVKVT
jgi:hypothetical protein